MSKDFNVIHEECFYDSDTQKLTITIENSGNEDMTSPQPSGLEASEHNIFPVSPDEAGGGEINFEQNGITYDFYKSGNYLHGNFITIDADYSTVTSKTSDNTYTISQYYYSSGTSTISTIPPLKGNDKITFVLQLSGIDSNTTYVFGADYQYNNDSEEVEHNEVNSNNFFAFGYGIPNASVTSPICFAKGTIVNTDQGNVEIQNIVPGKHTIGEKAI